MTRAAITIALIVASTCSACGEREPREARREPAPSTPEPHGDPRCIALCEHSAACLDARGIARSEAERDCAASCRPGGLYAAMPEDALACATHRDCTMLDACTGAVLDAVVAAREAEPSVLREWPAELPAIPGATPLPVRQDDPLTLAKVAYAGAPEGMESLLRAELERAGWQLDPTIVEENALRFFVRREGTELGISIYAETPGRTIIQVFGFDASRP